MEKEEWINAEEFNEDIIIEKMEIPTPEMIYEAINKNGWSRAIILSEEEFKNKYPLLHFKNELENS